MMEKYKVVLASRNKGKVAELQRLLNESLGDVIELLSLDDVGLFGDIEENGETFEENALIKARAAAASGYIGLGDDSGLAVYALDMAPGVYSARYAGDHGEGHDERNNALLLHNMEGVTDRGAEFVCTLAMVFPDERDPLVVRGTVVGEILTVPRGEGGFGYDPLFFYPPMGKTTAEMTADEKNQISHRGAAVRQMAKLFTKAVKGETVC